MTTLIVRHPRLFVLFSLALWFGLAATADSGAQNDKPPPETKFKWGEDHLKDKARWEYKLLDKAGKHVDRGTFMGRTNGTITQGTDQKQIGSWKRAANVGQFTLIFTKGNLAGTASVHFINADRPTLEGTLVAKKSKKKLVIEILND